MLILTRKKNETVHIGEGITITVIRVSGNKVRLGISAPQDVRVTRIELAAAECESVAAGNHPVDSAA